MMAADWREAADRLVPAQRCAFRDPQRGYCERAATVHLWTLPHSDMPEGVTMACDEHCTWFDDRRALVHDYHPVTGACALPNAHWVSSHPTAGPGWCRLDGVDWLAAVDEAEKPIGRLVAS